MAILKIAKMGDPVLRAPAQEVVDPTVPQIRALVSDMVETMVDAGGVGLAAPQVHVPLRIVIYHEPVEAAGEDGAEDGPDGSEEAEDPVADKGPLNILINPVIEPIGEETALGWEGCLSVPGMRGIVPRFTRIRYSGLDINGKPVSREVEGFHARVVQHECDHLDGVLYPQRMPDLRLLGFNEEFDRHPLHLAPPEEAEAEEAAAAEVPQGEGADGA
ncbi:MAG: peptide deformylase [Alphaproteobacteria bacterium]|nr:peptide deformylase [Alphaproteobacteria bacterium]